MRPATPCSSCGQPTRVQPISGAPRRHTTTGAAACAPRSDS